MDPGGDAHDEIDEIVRGPGGLKLEQAPMGPSPRAIGQRKRTVRKRGQDQHEYEKANWTVTRARSKRANAFGPMRGERK